MDATFVVMTDTHFAAPGTGKDGCWWNKEITSQSAKIAESLVSTVKSLSPDFIIHCGDLTDASDLESFQFGKQVMDRMSCPYYFVLGNHDTWNEGVRRDIAPLFDLSADDGFYFTRRLAGMRFIFLDCAHWIKKTGETCAHIDFELHHQGAYAGIGPTEVELQWLEQELAAHTDVPTVIVTHVPLHAKPVYAVGTLPGKQPTDGGPQEWVPVTPKRFEHESGSISKGYFVHDERVRQLIEGAPNVKAVFAGHWHMFDITRHNDVVHCQTGAMVEYPLEMRLVRVESRTASMSITTVALDDPQLKRDSCLPERKNEWVAGGPQDRVCTLSINV